MKKIKMKKLAAAMAVAVTAAAVMGNPMQAMAAEFDPVFYAAAYADVAAALGTDAEALYNHYVNYGQKEGRVPYAGAAAGEAVDGIVGVADTTVAQTPADTGNRILYTFDGRLMTVAEQQQKQQEFDASEYVKVGWTEEQVQAKLLSLKEVYPEGTYAGICQDGAGSIETKLYGSIINSLMGIDEEGNWIYPEGHVHYAYKFKGEVSLKDTVRVGDEINTKESSGLGHVQIVLSRDEQGITVVESNHNGDKKMHWGRRISWDELEKKWFMFAHYSY